MLIARFAEQGLEAESLHYAANLDWESTHVRATRSNALSGFVSVRLAVLPDC